MTVTVKRLQEERAKIAGEVKHLRDKVSDTSKEWTDADESAYQEYRGKIEDIDKRIERAKQFETDGAISRSDDELREQFERDHRDNGNLEHRRRESQQDRRDDLNDNRDDKPLTSREHNRAALAWMRCGTAGQRSGDFELLQRAALAPSNYSFWRFDRGLTEGGDEFGAPKSIAEVNEQARARRLQREERGTNIVGTDNLGGYTVPDEMMRRIDIAMLQFGGMRQVAEIMPTNTGAPLPIPTANDTNQEGEILGEIAATNEQEVSFGDVTLGAYKFSSKRIPISIELLQDSATQMPGFIGARIGERIGRIANRMFTVGTGTNQPRGIVTDATSSGITTASATALAYDEVLGLVHSVDIAYRDNARFMWHDNTLLLMKKMKDDQGRPLWMPSLIPGAPDTFDNFPYTVNNHMPQGTGTKAILFGDLSKYVIRDAMGLELFRFNELYMVNHKIAFMGTARMDGRLVDAGTHPVKYLTMG